MKPSILFAVGCDPKLAYRIFLEADYLSKTYELEVRGLSFERNFKPTHTQRNNYIVSTLPVKGTLALTKDILKGIPKTLIFFETKTKIHTPHTNPTFSLYYYCPFFGFKNFLSRF